MPAFLAFGCASGSGNSSSPPDSNPSADTGWADADADGYGDGHGDCDDTDPSVHKGHDEVCDGKDNDCDDLIDDEDPGLTGSVGWVDADVDGFGGAEGPTCNPAGQGGDCNDVNAEVHPGATEIACNEVDDDCDGAGSGPAGATVDGQHEYASVAEAITAISAIGEVRVCPGVHPERLVLPVLSDLLLSAWNHDAETTALDGGGEWRILYAEASTVAIENLTFQHGRGELHGGTEIAGALFTRDNHLDVRGSVFRENGAKYCCAAALVTYAQPGSVSFASTQFVENVKFGADGGEGALTVIGGLADYSLSLADVDFIGNEGATSALTLHGKNVELEMTDVSFVDNQGDGEYSTFKLSGFIDGRLTNVAFEDNYVSQGPGAMSFTWTQGSYEMSLDYCTFHRNDGGDSNVGGILGKGDNVCLTCEHCDFGEGADDNLGEDVHLESDSAGVKAGTDASFSCCWGDCDF